MTIRAILIGLAAAAMGLTVANATSDLDDASFELTAIDDSGSYFVYSYTASNSASSTWALQWITLDVSATSGTPTNLAATGDFLDLSTMSGATEPLAPYAEVGPISPQGWSTVLGGDADLTWSSFDSIPPDSALAGFAIRSGYLPGLATFQAVPTWESCCAVHDTITLENPPRTDFDVEGDAVGPRYTANEIDINLLQNQLDAVCDDPLWIDNTSLCTEMADSLDAAEDRLAIANIEGARAALVGFGGLIQSNVDPLGDIEVPAAYLLGINMLQLLENIGLPPA